MGFLVTTSLMAQPLVWGLFFVFIPTIDAVPYNVREIAGQDTPLISTVAMSLACYLVFGAPVLLERWLRGQRHISAWAFAIFLVSFLSGATFLLLQISVPRESLKDVLGAPIWDWPWNLEMMFRFTGIYAGIASCIILSALTVDFTDRRGVLKNWQTTLLILFSLCLFAYAHFIAVVLACTDNVVELMAGGGSWGASALLSGWLTALGVSACFIYKKVVYGTHSIAVVVLVVCALLPVGLMFFKYGTTSSLTKYGETFSAMQFLFSPDRSNYLQGPALIFNYCLAHLASVFLISLAQVPLCGMHRKYCSSGT